MSSGLTNLYRTTNQITGVGNPNPPNMASISDASLMAASPTALNLVQNTKVQQTVSDSSARACRQYTGVDGLRRLQRDQANRSYYDAGCGWRFQGSAGLNPIVNQGALGNADGPTQNQQGSPDEVRGGTKWYWDLAKAEKEISTQICKSSLKCRQLKLLGNNADICGFCKTTGAVIPVEKIGSAYRARYPNDPSLMCEPQDIVTAATGQCPPTETFQDFGGSHLNRGLGIQGNLREAFAGASLDDLDNCKPPLTRDCVIQAARSAGCSDKGSLIAALQGSEAGRDYDSLLQKNMAFNAYQKTANPGVTNQLLKDGSTSLEVALDDFGRVVKDTQSTSEKLRLAARDLCLSTGAFTGEEQQEGFQLPRSIDIALNQQEGYAGYNFCAEVAPTTVVSEQNIICLQNDWRNEGGTEKGTGFPQLSQWKGKTYKAYLDYSKDVFNRMRSTDKTMNAAALKEFVGVDSYGTQNASDLPRNDTTRGGETVWIDTGDWQMANAVPVILRCDLQLAKDGNVYPVFLNNGELMAKFQVPEYNIAFINAYEMRPESDGRVSFSVTTDDGMMIGHNQNPFENLNRNDWGSWRYQPPASYNSGTYSIAGVKANTPNVFVTKWFQGPGGAYFDMILNFGQGFVRPENNMGARANMYLTQEPLAPWCQYELCSRPNQGGGTRIGLFEKRWNGAVGYGYYNNKPFYSFDVVSGSVAFQTDPANRQSVPGKKGYASFTRGSWWHTTSYLAYNAFKTITLLVRPMANLSVGSTASIFQHCNFVKGFSASGVYLLNENGQYKFQVWEGRQYRTIPCKPNEWNLIVIQYISDRAGVRGVNVSSEGLATLQTDGGRRAFLEQLRSRQSGVGAFLVGNAVTDRLNSGYFVLGGDNVNEYKKANGQPSGWGQQSFTGDVAWIHGFRNFIDTDDLLKAEIQQTWLSRWPRANIDGEKIRCTFDAQAYSNLYPDLQRAFGGDTNRLRQHYIDHGLREGRSPCGTVNPDCRFNDNTYLTLHPDVRRANMDAGWHYRKFGINENRDVCQPK